MCTVFIIKIKTIILINDGSTDVVPIILVQLKTAVGCDLRGVNGLCLSVLIDVGNTVCPRRHRREHREQQQGCAPLNSLEYLYCFHIFVNYDAKVVQTERKAK